MAILFIDKSAGISSFDVIRRLQREMGRIKMGHGGTLDPMATGLMIIATESDTKRLSEFLKLPKVYEAEILLGVRMDTGDMTGKLVEERPVEIKGGRDEVSTAIKGMVGLIALETPIYSAIKKNGKSLYKYARQGAVVVPPIKQMEVRNVEFLSIEGNKIRVVFDVGSGTYIRSLAEELGRRLGTVATLSGLRRLSIGKHSVEGAKIV